MVRQGLGSIEVRQTIGLKPGYIVACKTAVIVFAGKKTQEQLDGGIIAVISPFIVDCKLLEKNK